MPIGLQHLLNSLAQRDLITPYFEANLLADNWPEKYTIEIDSSPYYGLDEDGKPDGYFHPSTHACLGERELYYRFHPAYADKLHYERPSLQRELAFAMGSALHGVVQTQMEMCGLVTRENIEVEYENEAHHVRGRIDWVTYHPILGTILPVEFKTRTAFKYSKQLEPEPGWTAQLNLGLDAMNADLGVLLMMESGFPYRMREFPVQRDRELLKEIYAKFDRVRAAVAASEPPRHCCAPDSLVMKKCPARFECWLKDSPRGGK